MGRFLAALQSLCCVSGAGNTSNPQPNPRNSTPSGVLPVNHIGEVVVTIEPTSPSVVSSYQNVRRTHRQDAGELHGAAIPAARSRVHPRGTSNSIEIRPTLEIASPGLAKRAQEAPLLDILMQSLNSPTHSPMNELQPFSALTRVGATSAAVLQLTNTKKLFSSREAWQYFSELDLSEGNAIVGAFSEEEIDHVKSYLDVRKYAIDRFCESAAGQGITQVIFLGDGLNPYSIDFAARYPNVRVLGLDANFMVEKHAAASRLWLMNARYGSADLQDVDGSIEQLARLGYRSNLPALVVAEGIFMYMDTEICKAWQRQFFGAQAKHQQNHMIFDIHTPIDPNPSNVNLNKMEQLHANVGNIFEEHSGLSMARDSVLQYLGENLSSEVEADSYTWGQLEKEILERPPEACQFNDKTARPPSRMIYLHPNLEANHEV